MRLLAVEDEQDLAGALAAYLCDAGHVVDLAPRLGDAEAAVAGTDYDLIPAGPASA